MIRYFNNIPKKENFSNDDNIFYNYDAQTQNIGSSNDDNQYVKFFFSQKVIDIISRKVTKLTKGVDEHGRDIIIPNDKIFWTMNTVYSSYNQPSGFDNQNFSGIHTSIEYIENLIQQTVDRIVYDVTNTLGIEQCMNKWTNWTSLYGDFNDEKLRAHPPIKIQRKRPTPMQFFEKY